MVKFISLNKEIWPLSYARQEWYKSKTADIVFSISELVVIAIAIAWSLIGNFNSPNYGTTLIICLGLMYLFLKLLQLVGWTVVHLVDFVHLARN